VAARGRLPLRAPTVAREADLTRIIRQLLRELKRQVLANVSATVSVDYDDTTLDGLNVIAMAKVPSLVLSGPTLRPNRFYSANVAHEDVVGGVSGPELVRRKPPYTVDLVFTLTAASERTAELFNLMAAVATFLNRNRWLELQRDPADASRGSVRWELDADGEFRTQLAGKDDVRAFTCGFVVRGFDVDEGLPLDLGKRRHRARAAPDAGRRSRRCSVTVSLTNTSRRCLVFVLAHETYCKALGECRCDVEEGRSGTAHGQVAHARERRDEPRARRRGADHPRRRARREARRPRREAPRARAAVARPGRDESSHHDLARRGHPP
jgi:hypothetical protein